MKKYIMYVNVADDVNLPEDIDRLPRIQIIAENPTKYRTVGTEQVTEAVLAVASFLEQHSEYIPFRVEIWDSNEPGSPQIRERRGRRIRREEGGQEDWGTGGLGD